MGELSTGQQDMARESMGRGRDDWRGADGPSDGTYPPYQSHLGLPAGRAPASGERGMS